MPIDPKLQSFYDSQRATILACSEARMMPLESACQLVVFLGYSPSECLIKILDDVPRRDVLSVRGVDWFEVTSWFDTDKLEFKVQHRWLATPVAAGES